MDYILQSLQSGGVRALYPTRAALLYSPGMSRFLPPLISVVVCLALTVLGLGLLPATRHELVDVDGQTVERDRPYTYGEKVGLVMETVYEKVIRPRPGNAKEGYRNWELTLQRTTPLLLAGLAIAVAFRANVLNIGGQGQYIAGAVAGTVVGLHWKWPVWGTIPMMLIAAMLAGAGLGVIAAGLERWRKVPVVLSTLLLNFIMLEVLRYLLQGPMRSFSPDGAPRDPQSDELPDAALLPESGEIGAFPGWGWGMPWWMARFTGRLYPPVWLALVAAMGVAFLLRRTSLGFRMRVVGQNEEAARFAGMNVGRVRLAGLGMSGALAGMAGMVTIASAAQGDHSLHPDLGTNGVGFTAIAVALLGRLSPLGVVVSAVFFGFLSTAFQSLERSDLQVHSSAAQAVQGGLILAIGVLTSRGWMGLVGVGKTMRLRQASSREEAG